MSVWVLHSCALTFVDPRASCVPNRRQRGGWYLGARVQNSPPPASAIDQHIRYVHSLCHSAREARSPPLGSTSTVVVGLLTRSHCSAPTSSAPAGAGSESKVCWTPPGWCLLTRLQPAPTW